MKKVSLGLLVSALLSTAAVAQVQLNVDDNIKVTAINGQAIHHGLLQPLQQNFTLEPGRHVITARYDRLFKLGRDDHDYLKSGDITITANLAVIKPIDLLCQISLKTITLPKIISKHPV